MDITRIIQKKRDGEALDSVEISAVIDGFVSGEVPEYQVAALAMAIYFQGMDESETSALTRALMDSGESLDWAGVEGARVDKHSTGGQGDKVSLVLAPLVASCGLQVPMVAGRGLGPTGGTIDKLESIPGYRTELAAAEIRRITEEVGCVIASQGGDFAPADGRLYALRDVTATVASVPLITASIMSKKLAEGLDALALDIKWGSGAFMKDVESARSLGEAMAAVGENMGVKTSFLVSDMNQPLGRAVGNANEVREALATLAGEGPADLLEVVFELGAVMLTSAGCAEDMVAARALLEKELVSGRPLEKFHEMVRAQGGDLSAELELAPASEVRAARAGYISAIDGEALGYALIALGGGRRLIEDTVDPSVGLQMRVRLGDEIEEGQPLLDLLSTGKGQEEATALIEGAFEITEEPATESPRLIVPGA
ncbi:MAG: thymidine phosphorylase [Planctomycetota bacterium]|nr:thymidine phosphorylase [Planctomycetota bacterium]